MSIPKDDESFHTMCLQRPLNTVESVLLPALRSSHGKKLIGGPSSATVRRCYEGLSLCVGKLEGLQQESLWAELCAFAVADLMVEKRRKACREALVAMVAGGPDVVVNALRDAGWRTGSAAGAQELIVVVDVLNAVLRAHPRELSKRAVSSLFSKVIPTMGALVAPALRYAFAFLVAALCDCTVELELSATASVAEFEVEICACYEVVAGKWLVCDDARVRHASAYATGALLKVVPRNRFLGDIANAVPLILACIDAKESPLYVLSGLGNGALSRCVMEGFQGGELPVADVKSLLVYALKYARQGEQRDLAVLREAERCVIQLSQFEPDIVLEFLSHLDGSAAMSDLLRLALDALGGGGSLVDARKALVIMGMKECLALNKKNLSDNANALAMLNLISCVTQRGFLSVEGGQYIADWLVTHALAQQHQQLHDAAAELLHLCAKTCPSMCWSSFWPDYVNYLMDPKCGRAVGPICNTLALILEWLEVTVEPYYIFDWGAHPNLVPLFDVLARLFVFICDTKVFRQVPAVVRFLSALGPHIHPALCVETGGSTEWHRSLQDLTHFVEQQQEGQIDGDAWLRLTSAMVNVTLSAINDDMWRASLARALVQQQNTLYEDAVLKWLCVEVLRLVDDELARHHFGEPTLMPGVVVATSMNHADESEAEGHIRNN